MASLFQKSRATRYKTGLSRSCRSRNERKYSRDYHEDESDEESGGATRNSTVDNKQNNDNNREATEDYQLEGDIYSDIDSHDEQNSVSNADLANNNTNNLSNREQRRRRRWTHPEAHFRQKYAPCSTIFCIAQCIILFLMMWQCGIAPLNINPMLGPGPDVLNYWGAKNAVLIIDDDEDWRLITPIFLHAGLIHLAGNVMVQIDAGNTWEKEWGSFIWMIIYIGSAFGSSVFSTCFMPDNISVGSSGAVMGLFGGKLAEILLLCCEKSTNLKELAGERSRKQQVCLVVGGIVLVALMSFIPYVDWAAHLGGMLAGLVLGFVCFSFKIRSWPFIILWFVVGVGSTIALYSGLMAYMYNDVETNDDLRDVCGYYQQYFDDYECSCQEWSFSGYNGNGNGNNSGDGGNSND